MHFPLIVRIVLWIVNIYSEFQVNIFSNKRDITKCQFLHNEADDDDADDNDAKAIAIPRFSPETAELKKETLIGTFFKPDKRQSRSGWIFIVKSISCFHPLKFFTDQTAESRSNLGVVQSNFPHCAGK